MNWSWFQGDVTDNIAGNVVNAATTKGGSTWGDFVAIPAAAAIVHFLPKNAFGTVGASAVYNVTRDWVNDAVNVPPYNGRPIFYAYGLLNLDWRYGQRTVRRTKTTHRIGAGLILRTENPIFRWSDQPFGYCQWKSSQCKLEWLVYHKNYGGTQKGNGGISR